MKLFGSTKNLTEKTKNAKTLEVVEVILVQCNVVDNQYQHLKYYTLLHPMNLMLIC